MLASVVCPACAGDGPTLPKIADLNPFKEKQQPLAGPPHCDRETTESISSNLADADQPITLPPQRSNDSWAQPGGDANNAPGHLALNGTVRQVWTGDAGEGSSKAGAHHGQPDRVMMAASTRSMPAARSPALRLSGGKIFPSLDRA